MNLSNAGTPMCAKKRKRVFIQSADEQTNEVTYVSVPSRACLVILVLHLTDSAL